MPRDALFAIASMTKPITAVAGLLLREEGRLGLADPIERFLPQLGNRRVAMLNQRVLAGQGPIETELSRSGRSQSWIYCATPRASPMAGRHDRGARAVSGVIQLSGRQPQR